MARSVSEVSRHVQGTSVAVIAMKTATVIAEQNAADHISNEVTTGFHRLIMSQVAQKAAKAKAVVDSKQQELLHLKISLQHVRAQMERDFHRISHRYGKLFKALNDALIMRVRELDRMAYALPREHFRNMETRVRGFAVQPSIHQEESVVGSQLLAMVKSRQHVRNSIEAMGGILNKGQSLKNTMAKILDTKFVAQETPILVPLLVLECDDMNIGLQRKSLYTPRAISLLGARQAEIHQCFQGANWQDVPDETRQLVMAKCIESASSLQTSDRIRALIINLAKASNWQVAGGISDGV
jgi:hypothetical protein